MGTFVSAIAGFSHRHRWVVIVAWIVLVVALGRLAAGVESRAGGDAVLKGTDSAAAQALLDEGFPDTAESGSPLVMRARSGTLSQDRIERTTKRLERDDAVSDATLVQRTDDKRYALLDVRLSVDATKLTEDEARGVLDAARAGAGDRVQVEASGAVGQKLSVPSVHRSELIGFVAAIIVLTIVGGTVPSMIIPILTALAALLVSLRAIALLGSTTSLPTAATTLASMIGIGVGIDYALFLLTRIRGRRSEGDDWPEAIRRASSTTGSAVLFAAITVAVALCALAIAGIPTVTKLGYCAAIAVAMALLATITLLPALTGAFGDRLERLRVRRGRVAEESAGWRRFADRVAGRPWPALLVSLVLLLGLAIPTTSLSLGSIRPSDQPDGTTQYRAYELVRDAFGAGATGVLTVVAKLDPEANNVTDERLTGLQDALKETKDVDTVAAPALGKAGVVRLQVTPDSEFGSDRTADLIADVRDRVLPAELAGEDAHVGGAATLQVDLAETIGDALPGIIAVVIGLSFVLLLIAFRSIVLPLKAALTTLLSVVAAYGVLTAVFELGWGASLIGLDGAIPVVSFVPMIMFAVLFGLSMDYEVLLLSRVQEAHLRGEDTHDSIVSGLAATGRLITAAAVIMSCVFASFILTADPTIKMFGLGLTVAIILDATVVRCLLVPAAMVLMGRVNWWLPRPLARLLPRLDLD